MTKLKYSVLITTFLILFGNALTAQKYLPVVKWTGPIHAAEQSKPAYLEEVTDPLYGTRFKRIADYDIWEAEINLINKNETRHYYSLRPVFNRNSTMYIVNWGQIRMVETNEFVGRASEIAHGFFNATWSKVDPDILYGTISNNFVALNVKTHEVDTIVVLDGFNTGPNDRLYMDNWQSIAGEDKYMVVSDVPTLGKQIALVDIQNRTILSRIEDAYTDQVFTIAVTDITETDSSIRMNTGISLSGDFIVIRGGNGAFLYDKYFNYIRELAQHGHADFGFDDQGRDVVVSICPAKYEVLETGDVYDMLGGSYACGHVNASANYLQPGWVYMTIERDDNDDGDNGITQDYDIIAAKIDPEGKTVRKIIHPHNTGYGVLTSAYGVPNPNGSLLMFNSAWDDFSNGAEIDAYMVMLTSEDSSLFSLETIGKGKVSSENAKISGIEGYYYKGYPLVLTATDTALGYAFQNWSGSISSTENPITVVLNNNKHVVANFEEIPVYSITTKVTGKGRVSSLANGNYTKGQIIKITAFPDWGYEFLRWEGDLMGTENPISISIDSNINITAVFSGSDGIFNHSATQTIKVNNHPNPFSTQTNITYYLKKKTKVTIKIYNLIGEEIDVLVNSEQNSGTHHIIWNPGKHGSCLSSGTYICKIETELQIGYAKLVFHHNE